MSPAVLGAGLAVVGVVVITEQNKYRHWMNTWMLSVAVLLLLLLLLLLSEGSARGCSARWPLRVQHLDPSRLVWPQPEQQQHDATIC